MLRREATCRLCGTTKDLTWHHVLPQRLAVPIRDDAGRVRVRAQIVESRAIRDRRNLVRLCRHHHDAIDTYRILRSLLRSRLSEQEVMHITNVAGPAWLDTAYPPTPKGTTP